MRLAAFNGPSLENLHIVTKISQISLTQAELFYPKFRCHDNQGGSGVKLNDTIRLAIPENHTMKPKITTLSYTQPKL